MPACLEEQIAQTVDPTLFARLCNTLFAAEYGHDYQCIDGTRADEGNDGWLSSQRRMFAIYCPLKPERRTDADYRSKALSDLEKAVRLRDSGRFAVARWTFVTPRKLSNDVVVSIRQRATDVGLEANHIESTHLGALFLKHPELLKDFPSFHVSRLEQMIETQIRTSTSSLPAMPSLAGANEIVDMRQPTPSNLLSHVSPGVPCEKVRKWLGAPASIHQEVWIYRYVDTQVQVTFDEKDVVGEVVVALVHGHSYRGSWTPWGPFELGTVTIADLQELGHSLIEHRSSMRTEELIVRARVGPPGAWSECVFGALVIFSGAGALAHVDFEWDWEKQELVSPPSRTLVNWIGMTSGIEVPYMYWYIEP